MDDPISDDMAHRRWMVIQVMRLFGFALAIAGILIVRGVIDVAGETNRYVGYAFVVIGLVDGFVMPQVLARKWRSPPR